MPSLRRRLLSTAALPLLLLASAGPAFAGGVEATAIGEGNAPTGSLGRTIVDEPVPIIEGAEPGSFELDRQAPKGRIVAGAVTDIRSVPWQVFLISQNGNMQSSCGGSIVGPTTIITAAHCIQGLTIGNAPTQNGLGVVAGISNFKAYAPTDVPQTRVVKAAAAHPAFNYSRIELAPAGDVAVLVLDAPLDLSGPNAKAIALPPAGGPASADGEPIPIGAVRISGFGKQGTVGQPNGQLYSVDSAVADPTVCGDFPNAVGICTKAPAGNICSGDSGGGLVSNGVIVGVVSVGGNLCSSGGDAIYANLLAPENRQFIANPAAAPPVAPRLGTQPTMTGAGYQAGTVFTCAGAAFDGGASVKYVITNDQGARLAAAVGPSIAYAATAADVGRKLRCRAYGSNAGGVATSGILEMPAAITPGKPPVATPTPKPTPKPITPGTSESPLGSMEMFASLPYSVRRGKRYSFTARLTNIPTNVASIRTKIDFRRPGGIYSNVGWSRPVDYTDDDDSDFYHRVRARTTSRTKVGKYRYRVTYFVTYADGTEVTDYGVWSFRIRR
ncbi:MAG: trypsin-like serine protease [Solirubrobacteraceae bacterium]|nr:trypsin-like serine protease [Solirubrobacteraceae bacterium]